MTAEDDYCEKNDNYSVMNTQFDIDKGRMYFKKICKSFNVFEKDFNSIFDGNPMFTTSAIVPQEGHGFLADLDSLSFSEDLKKYNGYPIQSPIWKRCLYKVKRMVKKIMKR